MNERHCGPDALDAGQCAPAERPGDGNGESEMTAPFAWAEELTEEELAAVRTRLEEKNESEFEDVQSASRPPVPSYFSSTALRRRLMMSGRKGC